MKFLDIKKAIRVIVLIPLYPVVWVMNRIMHRILLESGCWRCRAMIESGNNMGYGVRDESQSKEDKKK